MKPFIIGLKIFTLLTLLTGVVYPVMITVITQLVFPEKAGGSLVFQDNKIIGSELIGQSFKSSRYFWPRPSAVDFNSPPSGGSNLGATSKDLASKMEERKAQGLTDELLFASGSGLDPHISKNAALSQVDRILKARGMAETSKIVVFQLIERFYEDRQLGFLGEPRINVLKLNLELDKL